MSHISTISTVIKDLNALDAACVEMGFKLERPAKVGEKVKARMYGGDTIDCDAVVVLPGPYDIGLVKTPTGYEIKTDFYQGHVEKSVGKGCGRLLQTYGLTVTTRTMQAKGYNVVRQTGLRGSVNLLITGGRA